MSDAKINEQDTQPSMIVPDAASLEKPVVLKGDFGQGERTTPPAPEGPDFARGERTLPTSPVVADFASGEHTPPTPPENPDLVQTIPPVPVATDHKE